MLTAGWGWGSLEAQPGPLGIVTLAQGVGGPLSEGLRAPGLQQLPGGRRGAEGQGRELQKGRKHSPHQKEEQRVQSAWYPF